MFESFSQTTRPLWFEDSIIKKLPRLSSPLTVDVCVIGAGITGLTTADLLKRNGKTVAVIDLARVGSGETGHTTAHLTESLDITFQELISNFGLQGASLAVASARRAIDHVEANANEFKTNGLDCEFERVTGWRYTQKSGQSIELEKEFEAAQRIGEIMGLSTELVSSSPLPFEVQRALRIDRQAKFHPLKYLSGLVDRVNSDGSFIFEDTRMLDVQEGAPCIVSTEHGEIFANDVVIAANVPSTNRFFLHTKIAAYRTYAVALRLNPETEHRFRSPDLFWDLDDPYHYIRSVELQGRPTLIIGGEDHKTGQDSHASQHFARLEDWARERFDFSEVSHRWSGQVIEPVDGLPYIGRNSLSEHVYVATGFSGTGLTFGTAAGILISDLITQKQNSWSELFEPTRVKPMASLRSFLTENIDYPSHLIGDRLAPKQAAPDMVLRENEGAIMRMGAKKVAAYRDPQGEMHLLSPVCPHLGCYVNWNDAEKSWDCPCHGARFSPLGHLLNGPAVSDLATEPYDETLAMVPEKYENNNGLTDALSSPLLSFFTCPCHAKP